MRIIVRNAGRFVHCGYAKIRKEQANKREDLTSSEKTPKDWLAAAKDAATKARKISFLEKIMQIGYWGTLEDRGTLRYC